MAVVLDAAAHPPAERSDLVHEAIAGSGARRRVSLNVPDESVDLRVEAWRIGTAHVLRTAGTGLALTRTETDVRADAPELLAIALSYGESRYSVCGATQQLGRNGVLVVDFHTPYSFAPIGPTGSTFVTHIPYADLGLTVDEVRTRHPSAELQSPAAPGPRTPRADVHSDGRGHERAWCGGEPGCRDRRPDPRPGHVRRRRAAGLGRTA